MSPPAKPAMKFPFAVEGYHMGTVNHWGPTFSVSFDLKINKKSSQYTGVFHMMNRDLYTNADAEGTYKPAVFINANSSSLRIICNQYSFNTDDLPLAAWNNVRMSTGYCSEGNLYFKAYVNGVVVYKYKIEHPTHFHKMEVFVGSPTEPAAMADIDNFRISGAISMYFILKVKCEHHVSEIDLKFK